MTAIVALETETGVWIAADTQVTKGQVALTLSKINRLSCGVLIASTDSVRDAQIIEYEASPRQQHKDESDLRWLITAFVPSVYEALKRFEVSASAPESALAYNGRLYLLACDYSVIPAPVLACGSGAEVALGSLHGASKSNPEKAVFEAVCAAASATLYVNTLVNIEFQARGAK